MTQPIGSNSRARDADVWAQTGEGRSDSAKAADSDLARSAREMCLHADTVTEGFLCGEPTVVSNACRSPKNDFDKTVCDDKKMHDIQTGIAETTKDILKAIFGTILGKWGQ